MLELSSIEQILDNTWAYIGLLAVVSILSFDLGLVIGFLITL
jgi:hypothetical protein